MKRANLICGLVLLAVSVLMLYESSKLQMVYGRSVPGTGFVPFGLSVALAILSLILVVQGLLGAPGGVGLAWPTGRGLRWILTTVIALAAYAVLVGVIGYILSTFLFLLVLTRMLSSYRWFTVTAFSLLTSVALYSVFAVWLHMSLPRGVLIIP